MTFWIILSVIAVLAGLWIAGPFLKRGSLEMNDAEGAISVFRDQRDEVDRDLAEGLINENEHAAAHREIEQRALRAARDLDRGATMSRKSLPAAGAIVACGTVLVLAGYSFLGSPGLDDQPLTNRKMEILEQRAAAGDLNSRISLLIERTSQNPDSFEDWWTLGASYATTGDYASAVDAFRRAAELGGDRPGVLAAYGEAMVLANGNKVPTAARVIFEQVLQSNPDPRARYYVALAKAQEQDFRGALEHWAALAKDSAPDAPWMPLVRRDITNMARFLEIDVLDYLPDASRAEIAQASGASANEIAVTRANEVEAALKAEPKNYKGWIELAGIRAAQGDSEAAVRAIESAREHYAAAPFVLQKLEEAARDLGLDIFAEAMGPRGPSSEDIVAAQDMSAEDRSAMIESMVAGLAAKLEENPDDPEGWIMLVRSYGVLGNTKKARESYDLAAEHFAGNAQVLARLKAEAGSMISSN